MLDHTRVVAAARPRPPVSPSGSASADERHVLEAVLAVRAAMDRNDPAAVARMVARRLARLIPCAAAALFLCDGGALKLAAVKPAARGRVRPR